MLCGEQTLHIGPITFHPRRTCSWKSEQAFCFFLSCSSPPPLYFTVQFSDSIVRRLFNLLIAIIRTNWPSSTKLSSPSPKLAGLSEASIEHHVDPASPPDSSRYPQTTPHIPIPTAYLTVPRQAHRASNSSRAQSLFR